MTAMKHPFIYLVHKVYFKSGISFRLFVILLHQCIIFILVFHLNLVSYLCHKEHEWNIIIFQYLAKRNKKCIVRSSRIGSVFQTPAEKTLNNQGSFSSVTPPRQAEHTGTELLVISLHYREEMLLPASLLSSVLYMLRVQASSVDKAATDIPIYRVCLQIDF